MKILFITHFFPPETGAAATRIFGLASNLSDLGHEVTILTGYPNYPYGRVFEGYRVKFCSVERIGDLKVIRSYMYISPARGAFGRLANYLSFVFSSILVGIIDRQRYDVVFVSSPPLFLGISGYIISLVKRCPFIFDVRDIWPEIGVLLGEFQQGSLLNRLGEWLENFIYRKAKIITVVTRQKLQKLAQKGVSEEKLRLVSNGVDEEFINAPIDKSLRHRLGLEGYFVVVYAGLIGKAQGIDLILDAASILEGRAPDVRFLIIGEGVEKERLLEKASDLKLNNVRFLPSVPKLEVRSYLAMSDVAIIALKNSQLTDSVPSKLYEYMGSECPIVLCASGESRDILLEAKAGIAVDPDDAQGVANAILEMRGNEQFRRNCARNGLEYVKSRYLRTIIARELEAILCQVTRYH